MFFADIYCHFCEGIVPDKLKSAIIYPVHKGES